MNMLSLKIVVDRLRSELKSYSDLLPKFDYADVDEVERVKSHIKEVSHHLVDLTKWLDYYEFKHGYFGNAEKFDYIPVDNHVNESIRDAINILEEK